MLYLGEKEPSSQSAAQMSEQLCSYPYGGCSSSLSMLEICQC